VFVEGERLCHGTMASPSLFKRPTIIYISTQNIVAEGVYKEWPVCNHDWLRYLWNLTSYT